MIMPRGGAGLHTYTIILCKEQSTIPVITGGMEFATPR
jgi:gamma-glutamyl phosphate reductase